MAIVSTTQPDAAAAAEFHSWVVVIVQQQMDLPFPSSSRTRSITPKAFPLEPSKGPAALVGSEEQRNTAAALYARVNSGVAAIETALIAAETQALSLVDLRARLELKGALAVKSTSPTKQRAPQPAAATAPPAHTLSRDSDGYSSYEESDDGF